MCVSVNKVKTEISHQDFDCIFEKLIRFFNGLSYIKTVNLTFYKYLLLVTAIASLDK